MTVPYTPTCPECRCPWARHRAIDATRLTPPGAHPLERVRLRCENGCPCYGVQLPPLPAAAAGKPMIVRRSR